MSLFSMNQVVFYQSLNCSKTVLDIYIHQVWSSRVTRQNLNYLANTLTNTNGLLMSDLHHRANTLTNTDDKADNFTKEDHNLIL